MYWRLENKVHDKSQIIVNSFGKRIKCLLHWRKWGVRSRNGQSKNTHLKTCFPLDIHLLSSSIHCLSGVRHWKSRISQDKNSSENVHSQSKRYYWGFIWPVDNAHLIICLPYILWISLKSLCDFIISLKKK